MVIWLEWNKCHYIPHLTHSCSMLFHNVSDNQLFFPFFSHSHMVSNSSSLFMLFHIQLIWIWIYINIMDMKVHMLICFFIFMLTGREKEWGSRLENKIGMNCLWNCLCNLHVDEHTFEKSPVYTNSSFPSPLKLFRFHM